MINTIMKICELTESVFKFRDEEQWRDKVRTVWPKANIHDDYNNVGDLISAYVKSNDELVQVAYWDHTNKEGEVWNNQEIIKRNVRF